MTELDICNAMLAQEGQDPLTTLDPSHPSMARIRAIIRRQYERLLGQGYWFNTPVVELTQNPQGELVLPANTLAIREYLDTPQTYLTRQGNLLLPTDASEPPEKVTLRLVVLIPITDLPQVALEYLSALCQLEFARTHIKDPTEVDGAMRLAQEARIALRAEAIRQSQYTPGASTYTPARWAYDRNRVNRLAGNSYHPWDTLEVGRR